MDEINDLAAKLEAAIKEQRAIRGRAEPRAWLPDELDRQVQEVCQRLLDASGVDNGAGCSLCGC